MTRQLTSLPENHRGMPTNFRLRHRQKSRCPRRVASSEFHLHLASAPSTIRAWKDVDFGIVHSPSRRTIMRPQTLALIVASTVTGLFLAAVGIVAVGQIMPHFDDEDVPGPMAVKFM